LENTPLKKEHNVEAIHNAAHGEEGFAPSPKDSPNNSLSHGSPGGKAPKKPRGPKSNSKKESGPPTAGQILVRHWFVTFMCMNIPIIGWIYLMTLAFSRSKDPRKDFAKAYLLYKLVFLLLSLVILAVAIHYGLELLDKVLAYMEML